MDNESWFLRNEPCPKCREGGQDNTGDNLAVYSDGHTHCWSCGYHRNNVDYVGRFLHKHDIQPELTEVAMSLPEDCVSTYPNRCIEWIETYELTRRDLLINKVLWSESDKRLIFPLWGEGQALLGWQARNFSSSKGSAKWIGRGKLQEVYHFIGKGRSENTPLVIVEDIVSAIKVAKIGAKTLPLFGMNAKSRFSTLFKLMERGTRLFLWLDPNMYTQMTTQSRVGRLRGLNITPIFSTKDPKEHSYDEIREYLK